MSKTYDYYETQLNMLIKEFALETGYAMEQADEMILGLGWSKTLEDTLASEQAKDLYRKATSLAEALYDNKNRED
jgi:hypothetical protein